MSSWPVLRVHDTFTEVLSILCTVTTGWSGTEIKQRAKQSLSKHPEMENGLVVLSGIIIELHLIIKLHLKEMNQTDPTQV